MATFTGKNVLITGAAHGIGKLMAGMAGARGANLVISDVNAQGLEATADEFRAQGFNVKTYVCDISDREKVYDFAAQVHDQVGQVDILINNAGIVCTGEILDLPDEKHRQQVEVNLMGTLWMLKAFVPDMIKRDQGFVANIASSAGLQAVPGMGMYSATKHALVGLNDGLRLELKNHKSKVKTMVVCPYMIKTGMFEGMKTPFYLPALEPADMAAAVIKGIEKNRTLVAKPLIIYLLPSSKTLLPAWLWDFMLSVMRMTKAVYSTTGFCTKH